MDTLSLVRSHPSTVVIGAAVAPFLVAAGLGATRASVTSTTAALVLVLVVVAAAATGLRSAGVVAALSAGAWYDYFLTQPYNSFKIDDPDDLQAAVLLLVIGVAVSEIAQWGLRHEARASRWAGYLDGVLGMSDLAATGYGTPDELAQQVAHQVATVLGVDDCRYEPAGHERGSWTSLHRDGTVWRGGRQLDVERGGLPTDDLIVLPVTHDGRDLGQLAVSASVHLARPGMHQRRIAVLLADQLGSALAVPSR